MIVPKLAANLSTLFAEMPQDQRFEAAAAAGFDAVEMLFPYDSDPTRLRGFLSGNELRQVLFNLPPGDWERGERGLASLPDRRCEFEAGVDQAINYAEALSCPTLHCMAGRRDTRFTLAEQTTAYEDALRHACRAAAAHGITVTIEPINSHDVPDYLLTRTEDAIDMLDRVGADNLALQFDIYHSHMMSEDVSTMLVETIDRIAHIQVSDAPGRGAPGSGRIPYDRLLPLIDELGYDGWVGCEYRAVAPTTQSLAWAAIYLTRSR